MTTQQRLILLFFIIALILLSANILVGKVFKTENTIIQPATLSAGKIDSLFHKAVLNFGLPRSAVKSQRIKEVKIEKNLPSYLLHLPKDLPIPVFISELNDLFSNFAVNIFTDEKSISGRTILQIFSEDEIKLASAIDYSPDLKRESSTVGFLVSIDDKTDKTVIDDLLSIPEPFGFLFTPSVIMKSFVASNQNSNRQYALLLGDETKDLDFKFESGYSERRLKSSVRNLLAAFPRAAFFILDDKSSFYSSAVFPFVEKEFLSRKLKMVKKSELNFLAGSVSSSSFQFNELLRNTESNSNRLISCTPADFKGILDDIRRLRKIGFKYVIPSEAAYPQSSVQQ